MELSKTAYVILGMLNKGARSGYEIKGLVDVSTRFFWAASYGQIYPELKRLEQAGLIEGEADPTGGRQRSVYTLTEAGRQELHAWLTRDGGLHLELRHEGVLRFFFADALDRDEQIELLRTIRAEHERLRGELQAICPATDETSEAPDESFPLLTLEWGIAYQDFIVGWCTEMEQRLQADPSATEGS